VRCILLFREFVPHLFFVISSSAAGVTPGTAMPAKSGYLLICDLGVSGVPCVDPSIALTIVDRAAATADDRTRAVPLQRVRMARVARRRTRREPEGPREIHRALTEAELERLEPDKPKGGRP
jgi:hypothetical protein